MQRAIVIRCATAVGFALLLPLGFSGCTQTPGGGVIPFNLPPNPVITSDVIRGVAPLAVQFNSDRSTDDGLIVERRWDFGDGSTSQEISPRHTFQTTGDYTVTLTLTDDLGAEASRTQIISVTQAPVAVITVDPESAASAPAVFEFDGSASFDPDPNGVITKHEWDFGDGSREFLETVTHVYASSGTYRAKLTVTDNKGVTGLAERLIAVGIPTPTIELRVPPPDVSNLVLPTGSLLWTQATYNVQPGAAHFARAGIDRDRDQCDAQSVLYDLATGTAIWTLTGHDDRVTDVAFAPNGNSVVTASDDGTLRRYNLATGGLLSTYTGNGRINAVAFSPDGLQIVWGQSDGDVVLAEVASGTIIRTFTGHTSAVNDVEFSPGGDEILSGASDRRALLWNVSDGTVLRDLQHTLGINAVAFSPADQTMVATGSEDTAIKIWNTTSGTELVRLTGHGGPVNDLVFSSDGMALISASSDNTARAWSPFLGTSMTTYAGHSDDVVSVAISADGAMIVTGSVDGTARVWNSVTAETLATVQPCESTISSIAISPDSTQFVAGVAARNDVVLDTDPSEGGDLNITYPRGLTLTNVPDLGYQDVPAGSYSLWAEIDTDQTETPVRTYANAQINVIDEFTTTVDNGTPVIPLLDDQASVVLPESEQRQVFDLGPLDRGDRLFISLLSVPGFGEFHVPDEEFSIMLLDANQRVLAWYQALELRDPNSLFAGGALEEFVLFTPDTKLVVGHNSLHYYVVADGRINVNVRIQRDTGLFETRQQRVRVRFDGGANVAAGNQPPRTIPPLDASDFDSSWDANDTQTLKTVIMARLENIYSGYDVQFFSSDDPVTPALPYQTIWVGGATPDGLLGISDYVDPRNETTTGTAIVYATEIANRVQDGDFSNPAAAVNDIGFAIGTVAAHQVGQLLGLRNTDDGTDIMQGSNVRQVGDPTIPRVLKTSLVTDSEQAGSLSAIGYQDAPLLLQETVGLAP